MVRQPGSSEGPSHLDLLVVAHSVRAAVIDDDSEQVHTLLCRLRADLVSHLRDERPRLSEARGSVRAVTTDGQQRLLELIDEVMLGLDDDPTGCNCLVRAVEIEIALRRQARLEATLLAHHPYANSP